MLLVEYSMMSTAMESWLHWVLPQHGPLVLEVAAAVVVEVHIFLLDRLETAAVLENLCLVERRL